MKLRKKFMGLAVAALMAVSAVVGFTPATAHAANAEVKLVPQKAEVKAGETVVIDVQLSGNTGMTGLVLKYTYDSSAFEYVSAEDAGVLNGWVNPAAGTLMWKDSLATTDNTANGKIAKLTFKAKSGVEGTFNFGLSLTSCVNSNLSKVALTTTGTSVTFAHEHSFGDWKVTTPATCGAAGVETRECSCGEKETRTVAATGNHTYGEWKETVAPGCETTGTKVKECSCGHKVTETIPAKGHTYGEEKEDAATCTEAGSKYKECACGHKEVTETIPATGHLDVNEDGICDECNNEIPKQPVEDDKEDNKDDNKEDNKDDNKDENKDNAKEEGKENSSNPATGDATSIMIWVALMVAAAVVIFNKKRINA